MTAQEMRIHERSAWQGEAIGGKRGLEIRFDADHIAALDRLLRQTAALETESIGREAFDDPAINGLLADVADEMASGRGAAVLCGLSREKYTDDELTRIFWGIGLHLGVARPQKNNGEKIDHIRDMGTENPLGRRQYNATELVFHTDDVTGQNLGLLCLTKSKSGGLSKLVSGLTIHNEFAANHPELLEQLYEGFFYHRKGKQRPGLPIITSFKVPIFSNINEIVTVQYIREYMDTASQNIAGGMPEKMKMTLDYFDELTNREDLHVSFMLEPGEIMLINNRAVLHSRTAFEDHAEPDRKRHLVRLWMDVPEGRPFKREMDYMEDTWEFSAQAAE